MSENELGEPQRARHARARGQPREQVVDPVVSRAKFEREVATFRRHEAEYRRRGWFLLSADFPRVLLVLTAPQLRPAPVLFGVELDFQNYDVEPPSVRLVNPWTREPLSAGELLTPLPRMATPAEPGVPAPGFPSPADGEEHAALEPKAQANGVEGQDGAALSEAAPVPAMPPHEPGRLMQWTSLDAIPFLCTRGVREYHRHPAHTGDSWLLHRGRGEGTLSAIVEAIDQHGRAPIRDYTFTFGMRASSDRPDTLVQHISVRVTGFMNVLEGEVRHPTSF